MQITKTTGEQEEFSRKKFVRSIERAGATPKVAEKIAARVLAHDGVKTTAQLHTKTLRHLTRSKYRPVAARYDLKRAIMQLGPSGYPFEKFVAEVFSEMGYKVRVGVTLAGKCVRHEVDVVAENEERKVFIECKYHRQKGVRSDIKVALYIKARFDDVREVLGRGASGKKLQGLIVTNTQFSHDAEQYAKCTDGLGLISWSKPRGFSLAELIDRTGLHPVSAIAGITHKQRRLLMDAGTVLCRQIAQNPSVLSVAGIPKKKFARIVAESEAICNLRETIG